MSQSLASSIFLVQLIWRRQIDKGGNIIMMQVENEY